MQIIGRILISAAAGVIIGGIAGFINFLALSLFDNQKAGGETIAFGLIEGVICALAGFFIGFFIGAFNLGAISGACVGFMALIVSTALFVLIFGGAINSYGYIFRQNWRVLLAFWTVPMILTGISAALLKNLIFKNV